MDLGPATNKDNFARCSPCFRKAFPPIVNSHERIQELLEHNTKLRIELRESDRKRMVREFHAKFDQTIGTRPDASDADLVRFRLRLIAEEFFELVVATFADSSQEPWRIRALGDAIKYVTEKCPVRVDFPAFVDATIDLDYVLEGTRVALGVDSTPIWAEVQRANLSKTGGTRGDGKILKGENWVAPDIAGRLREQGWAG